MTGIILVALRLVFVERTFSAPAARSAISTFLRLVDGGVDGVRAWWNRGNGCFLQLSSHGTLAAVIIGCLGFFSGDYRTLVCEG